MRPRVEQQAPFIGGCFERVVTQWSEPCEEDEQRTARDRADRVELQAADLLRDGGDGLGPATRAGSAAGQSLRVQRQPARMGERDAARRAQMPSPGRNSFVYARCAMFALEISLLRAIHAA